MKTIREILLSNKAWSDEMRERRADYFDRQTSGQNPDILWIGCSDSRVSPEQITQTRPGELFIHRNVANIVQPDDENFLSVLQYAVDVLKVPHIVLCGHLGCGGIAATLKGGTIGPIDSWLGNARSVAEQHSKELSQIENIDERVNRLVELNVREQLIRLAGLSIVRNAFEVGQNLTLHGWVYDMRDGIVSELLEIQSLDELDQAAMPPAVISVASDAKPEAMRSA